MNVSYFILPSPYQGIFNLFPFFCNYKQCNKSFHTCASISPGKIYRGGISRSKDVDCLHFDRSLQTPLCRQSDNKPSHTIWANTQDRLLPRTVTSLFIFDSLIGKHIISWFPLAFLMCLNTIYISVDCQFMTLV